MHKHANRRKHGLRISRLILQIILAMEIALLPYIGIAYQVVLLIITCSKHPIVPSVSHPGPLPRNIPLHGFMRFTYLGN